MYETQIVGEAVAGEAAKVRKQLEKIISESNRSAFDIAELSHKVKKGAFYVEWGFNTFQEYAATLDIKARKLQYLARMASVMETVGIAREKYEPLGIAKLREITSLEPTENYTNPQTQEVTPMKEFIVGFVEKGAEMSLDDIKQHVRTLKGFVGENDLVWKNLCFIRSFVENVFDPAVEITRNAIGSVGKDEEGVSKDASESACVEVWAAEYMNNPTNHVLPESEG